LKLQLQPLTLKEAKSFVNEHHRHNVAPQGTKFSIGLNDGEKVIGVAMVGHPIALHNEGGYTLEVVRCCVLEEYQNARSKLYAAAWRAGYTRSLLIQ